jgi:hypothetical protein
MKLDITPLLQAAVQSYRSPDADGSNGALGLSKLMRISNGILSRKVSPVDTGAHCSPEEFVTICRETGDLAPLHAMAAALGCVLLPMTADASKDVSPVLATNFREDGEWLQAASAAYASPALSDNQLAAATKEGIESIKATAETIGHLYAKNAENKAARSATLKAVA